MHHNHKKYCNARPKLGILEVSEWSEPGLLERSDRHTIWGRSPEASESYSLAAQFFSSAELALFSRNLHLLLPVPLGFRFQILSPVGSHVL
jgi:hypothetical protein